MVHWKEIVREKRRSQAESIPPAWRLPFIPEDFVNSIDVIESCDIISDKERQITKITDAPTLLRKMASGELFCLEVTTAFCKRAAIAHQLINCCTEMFFERALKQAKELDDHLARTGSVVGPLHGLPISIKDGFEIEGIDTTVGWAGLIGKPAERSGSVVRLLLSLGAVLYVKTNIPQSLMMSDSYNHVFGQSVNAFNKHLISGGSSGGEGALVGAQGSIIGVGTDIGGSIRIPAALQGLYGLLPSVGRIPWEKSSMTQNYIVQPVAGPISHTLGNIETFMKAVSSSCPWKTDPRALPIPWREELAKPPTGPLRIAFIFDDGVVKPQPPISRALRETAARLKAAGHEVIEWDASSHDEGINLWLKAVLADGGEDCHNMCKLVDEPLIQGMLVGEERDKLDIRQRQQLEMQKIAYREMYLAHWNKIGIDALVMPVMAWVNFKPRTWVESKQLLGYSALWNLLDYAALAVPITKVDPVVDTPDSEWVEHKARNESDAFNHQQYNVNLVKGMPVSLQVVTERFGEEKAISIGKVIESLK
ncbi:acetamidase-A [Histoplasma capsulatum var. duboisii H88]|uniref:amidase n=2 Tax=Ajellomyces capsulatus TaxID=5037 RepID=F0UV80_AJEC8|nr:fatty-acid amide hydrolase [Histoplasma capsulatum H143]EGC49807.1 acetamidase-A [Histoplasma capsulatum var. duboisii H88]QSS50978.1 amidase [Histoplasma capsulatum var. duboisii H88]